MKTPKMKKQKRQSIENLDKVANLSNDHREEQKEAASNIVSTKLTDINNETDTSFEHKVNGNNHTEEMSKIVDNSKFFYGINDGRYNRHDQQLHQQRHSYNRINQQYQHHYGVVHNQIFVPSWKSKLPVDNGACGNNSNNIKSWTTLSTGLQNAPSRNFREHRVPSCTRVYNSKGRHDNIYKRLYVSPDNKYAADIHTNRSQNSKNQLYCQRCQHREYRYSQNYHHNNDDLNFHNSQYPQQQQVETLQRSKYQQEQKSQLCDQCSQQYQKNNDRMEDPQQYDCEYENNNINENQKTSKFIVQRGNGSIYTYDEPRYKKQRKDQSWRIQNNLPVKRSLSIENHNSYSRSGNTSRSSSKELSISLPETALTASSSSSSLASSSSSSSGSEKRNKSMSNQNRNQKYVHCERKMNNYNNNDEQETNNCLKTGKLTAIQLRANGLKALINVAVGERVPLFLTDVQHLLMLPLFGDNSPCTPERWCSVKKVKELSQTVVVVLDGISLYNYMEYSGNLKKAMNFLTTWLEVLMPPFKDGSVLEHLIHVPITCMKAQRLIMDHGSLEAAIEINKDPTLLLNNIFPIKQNSCDQDEKNNLIGPTGNNENQLIKNDDIHSSDNSLPPSDKFSRTKLLLSALQLVDEGYPMPLKGKLMNNFSSYVFTKDIYTPVNNSSPLFGVDCEMCRTSLGINEITRISIVNEQLETIYETLVRPDNKIIDYLTKFSGITPEIMSTATKSLSDVHSEIRRLLPSDAILVGQSLNCDLNAMRMMHPYIIDTSVCFNTTGVRRRKTKLKKLALIFLNEVIQERDGGHDSIEDSISSMKLVQKKLANSVDFGDAVLLEKKRNNSEDNFDNDVPCDYSEIIKNNERSIAVVSTKPLSSAITSQLNKAREMQSSFNEEARLSTLAGNTNGFVKNNVKVTDYQVDSNKEAIKKTNELCRHNALTLTNLHFSSSELLPANSGKTFKNISDEIRSIWRALSANSLLMVMMGGNDSCTNGLLMYGIKKH